MLKLEACVLASTPCVLNCLVAILFAKKLVEMVRGINKVEWNVAALLTPARGVRIA